jgi:hypothetical protein
VASLLPPTMMLTDNAEALALAMIDAGREPMWVVLVVGWYFGSVGREAALRVVGDKLSTSGYAA